MDLFANVIYGKLQTGIHSFIRAKTLKNKNKRALINKAI